MGRGATRRGIAPAGVSGRALRPTRAATGLAGAARPPVDRAASVVSGETGRLPDRARRQRLTGYRAS